MSELCAVPPSERVLRIARDSLSSLHDRQSIHLEQEHVKGASTMKWHTFSGDNTFALRLPIGHARGHRLPWQHLSTSHHTTGAHSRLRACVSKLFRRCAECPQNLMLWSWSNQVWMPQIVILNHSQHFRELGSRFR